MTYNQNNNNLKKEISKYPLGKSPVIDDAIIKGGYRVVRTIKERNAIDCCHRKLGMRVMGIGQDYSYKDYILKGGTMLKSKPVTNPLSYEYTNPTTTNSLQVTSDSKVINTRYQDAGGVRLQRLAVFKYNVVTKVGSFDINDTTPTL